MSTTIVKISHFVFFEDPKQLMVYFGIVPPEHAKGYAIYPGGILRTDNRHVRRTSVEAA